MNTNDSLFIITGLIAALSGFGYYAFEVWKAYKDEKRKIKGDFQLSQKYEPERAMMDAMIFITAASTSVFFVLVLIILLLVSEKTASFPVATDLSSKFVMLMGAVSMLSNISRVENGKSAIREFSYMPALPNHIKEEKDLNKKYEMIDRFTKENNLIFGRKHFGRYFLFHMLPESVNIQLFGIAEMLIVFSGLVGTTVKTHDITQNFANTMLISGVLYVFLVIPIIISMKKSAEIPMTDENFAKKLLIAVYGFIPSIIGLVIMIYAMLPLIS